MSKPSRVMYLSLQLNFIISDKRSRSTRLRNKSLRFRKSRRLSTPVGGSFFAPGTKSFGFADRLEDRYFNLCFILLIVSDFYVIFCCKYDCKCLFIWGLDAVFSFLFHWVELLLVGGIWCISSLYVQICGYAPMIRPYLWWFVYKKIKIWCESGSK